MFVAGNIGNDINEYTLSAFDVSTAVFVDSFSISSQDLSPQGLAFSSDGTKMFVAGNDGDDINEFTLSAFDVSTAVFVDSFSVSSQETAPRGLAFSSDGTKMFVAGDTGDDINEYDLLAKSDIVIDVTPPTFTADRTGDNTIVLTFSENVDTTTTDGSGYAVTGGLVTANTDPAGSSNTMTLTTSGITDTSATPTVTYTQAAGTTVDATANEVANNESAVATDSVAPNVSSSTLDEVTGVLVITFSETIDATPTTDVDLSKLFISDTGNADEIALTGASITTIGDSTSISITLTESQKQSVIALTTPQLDIDALAVKDTTGNTILAAADNAITVTVAFVPPSSSGGGGGGSKTPPQITDSTSSVLSIDAAGFAATFDVDLNDPFSTAVLVPEDRVIFTMDLYDNRGINSILYVSLYLSEQEDNLRNLRDSKTYITYVKNEPLLVSDPNGFFSDVSFEIIPIDEGNFVLKYDIGFNSTMGLSDVLLYMWNTDRYIAKKFFESAIEVIPLEEDASPEKIIEDKPIISQEIFDSWSGYSSDITTDKEFLEHIGIEGDTTPKWLKENFAKWIKKDLLTNEDLINAIKYLSSRGII